MEPTCGYLSHLKKKVGNMLECTLNRINVGSKL
jgi:hypothetical protein